MRKTAAILALLLGVGFLIGSLAMLSDDGKNAGEDISEASSLARSGDTRAIDHFIQDAKDRKDEERNYGLIGAVGIIAGFALWPRKPEPRGTAAISTSA